MYLAHLDSLLSEKPSKISLQYEAQPVGLPWCKSHKVTGVIVKAPISTPEGWKTLATLQPPEPGFEGPKCPAVWSSKSEYLTFKDKCLICTRLLAITLEKQNGALSIGACLLPTVFFQLDLDLSLQLPMLLRSWVHSI